MEKEILMRVLIVDDEPCVAETLEAGLVSAGHQVLSASTGGEALQIVTLSAKKRKPVELLLTDLIIPGVNGLELIRSAGWLLPGLAAILITAYGVNNVRKEVMSLGSCQYLEKPFNIAELTNVIDMLFEKGRSTPASCEMAARSREESETTS